MTPYEAYELAIKIGPSKELERFICIDATQSYWYAKDVLKGPFLAGEDAIASVAWTSYYYARNVLKEPFPAGEKAIAAKSHHGDLSLNYAKEVLKGPFPAGEANIAKWPHHALEYACHVLKGPFPAGEEAIASVYQLGIQYATEILHGPFKSLEDNIIGKSTPSYLYSINVIKDRFIRGESAIWMDKELCLDYAFRFENEVISELKDDISYSPMYSLAYSIMTRSRFPEGEPAMKRSPRIWKRYQEFLDDAQ